MRGDLLGNHKRTKTSLGLLITFLPFRVIVHCIKRKRVICQIVESIRVVLKVFGQFILFRGIPKAYFPLYLKEIN